MVFDPAWPEGQNRAENEEVIEMFFRDGAWWDEGQMFHIKKAETL